MYVDPITRMAYSEGKRHASLAYFGIGLVVGFVIAAVLFVVVGVPHV